jgi:hypothetical protein
MSKIQLTPDRMNQFYHMYRQALQARTTHFVFDGYLVAVKDVKYLFQKLLVRIPGQVVQ